MPQPDALRDLGVRVDARGGSLRAFSVNASSVEARVSDAAGTEIDRIALVRGRGAASAVWMGRSERLTGGAHYTLHVDGPAAVQHEFDPERPLIDPWGRGLAESADGSWRSVVVDERLDFGGTPRPNIPWDRTVVYEAHVRGFSQLNEAVPAALRGTYAGLAHEASIAYLQGLGVTTIELMPVHSFVTEEWLANAGRTNYWGYNTLSFFTPHAPYATQAARDEGPAAVRREFAGMVRLLHAAGLEVILDVVYNHTAEEGRGGPVHSLRGLDNASFYRVDDEGGDIDTTGCGNTIDASNPGAARLVLDSMRYWAEELQVDGFRLDLAATLGRTDDGYTRDHSLLAAMLADPVIGATKLIAEPWDVGMGGWQTGNFPDGFVEWNDRYRDRMRDFWLSDLRQEIHTGDAGSGIGRFATRLAGSSNTFALERGPLASLNFITAHDGFTLADLTAYDVKHNAANGEGNRDGTDNNNSFNHGVEGETNDAVIGAMRRRGIRNLLGTLLLSAGVPMLTAGDEYGRSQRGNNNAYCQDSEMTWLAWDSTTRVSGIEATTRRLLELRAENPALRPARYGRFGEATPGASQMDWYNADGETMTIDQWHSPDERTLQYLVASTPSSETANRVLLVVHAQQSASEVVLPAHDDIDGYTLLWNSVTEEPIEPGAEFVPGDSVVVTPYSMQLFRAHGSS